MTYAIKDYDKKYQDAIIIELNRIANMDLYQWKWKFFGNPEIKSLINIVEDDGKLVGHMALQGMHFNIGTEIIPGSQAVDLFIMENYRRKGLFLKLGVTLLNSASSNMKIAIGFPNKSMPGHIKYGWRHIGMVPRAFKPLDIKRYSDSLENNLPMLKLALKFKSKEKALEYHDLTIQEIQSFPDDIYKFTAQALKDKNAVMRSAKYLNWRYCQAPHRKYVKFIAKQKEDIKGYIVGYESEKSPGHGYIADILVNQGDKTIARALIKALENHFILRKVFVMYTWVPNPDGYRRAFRESGYIFRKPTQPFIVRVNEDFDGKEKVFEFDRWFITMGDSDLH